MEATVNNTTLPMEDFAIPRPAADEYAPYYKGYIDQVPEGPFLEMLRGTGEEFSALLEGIPREKWNHRYAPGKWSVRDVVQHVIDTERVMAYRLLRLSRGDSTPLPGFDQDTYAEAARVGNRRPQSFVDEFRALRESNLYLIGNLQPDQLELKGRASDQPVSVRALAYILAGHLLHHHRLLREKYVAPAS